DVHGLRHEAAEDTMRGARWTVLQAGDLARRGLGLSTADVLGYARRMHESDRPRAVLTARAASRGFFLLISAAAAAAWAAGCSDAPEPATPQTSDAGPDVIAEPPDGGGSQDASPPKRDCSNDLNDEKIWTHLECSGLY